jgi:hypothetical protein
MLSYFEFQGIVAAFEKEIQRTNDEANRARKASQQKDSNPNYVSSMQNEARSCEAYARALQWGLRQVKKLSHQER